MNLIYGKPSEPPRPHPKGGNPRSKPDWMDWASWMFQRPAASFHNEGALVCLSHGGSTGDPQREPTMVFLGRFSVEEAKKLKAQLDSAIEGAQA